MIFHHPSKFFLLNAPGADSVKPVGNICNGRGEEDSRDEAIKKEPYQLQTKEHVYKNKYLSFFN